MHRKLIVILAGVIGTTLCGVCILCILPAMFLFTPVRYNVQANLSEDGVAVGTASGEELFRQYGCAACHKAGGVGPNLAGIYGETVQLEDGTTLIVDDAYLTRSILDSQAEIVAGYLPAMPQFAGQISEAEAQLLVEYIQTLEK